MKNLPLWPVRAGRHALGGLGFGHVLVPAAIAPAPDLPDCFYCAKDERLSSRMIEVCELKRSIVYLLRNQFFPGRCIVAYKEHKRELYELTPAELSEYMAEVAATAQAIGAVFHPDKINYAIFGDEVSHLHVHLAPKYRGAPGWGKPFAEEEDRSPRLLASDEYLRRIEAIRRELSRAALPK
jgi:diadenosine tetraphosphate (Ap4A) HIT family hydrolase